MAKAKAKAPKVDVTTYPYTKCREQHQWNPYELLIDRKAKVGIRLQKCANCPTQRKQVMSLDGASAGSHVRSPSYNYPLDYRIPGGIGRSELSEMRAYNFMQEFKAMGRYLDS